MHTENMEIWTLWPFTLPMDVVGWWWKLIANKPDWCHISLLNGPSTLLQIKVIKCLLLISLHQLRKTNCKLESKSRKKHQKLWKYRKKIPKRLGLLLQSQWVWKKFSLSNYSYIVVCCFQDGVFRQTEKASFRNFLIEKSNATSKIMPKRAAWLVDRMAAVQTF